MSNFILEEHTLRQHLLCQSGPKCPICLGDAYMHNDSCQRVAVKALFEQMLDELNRKPAVANVLALAIRNILLNTGKSDRRCIVCGNLDGHADGCQQILVLEALDRIIEGTGHV